jgi:hypothetical protein
MDEDDDYTVETLPACPMQVIDVAILILDSARRVASVPGSFLGDLTELVCRHANYCVAQKQMHRQAANEIERLVSGDYE